MAGVTSKGTMSTNPRTCLRVSFVDELFKHSTSYMTTLSGQNPGPILHPAGPLMVKTDRIQSNVPEANGDSMQNEPTKKKRKENGMV